jgi:hypothetical protein
MVFNNIKSAPYKKRYLFIRYLFITLSTLLQYTLLQSKKSQKKSNITFTLITPHFFTPLFTALKVSLCHSFKNITPEVPVDDRRWSEFRKKTYTVKNHKKWVISTRILSIKLLFNNLSDQQTQRVFLYFSYDFLKYFCFCFLSWFICRNQIFWCWFSLSFKTIKNM